jgi:hypothetical protein
MKQAQKQINKQHNDAVAQKAQAIAAAQPSDQERLFGVRSPSQNGNQQGQNGYLLGQNGSFNGAATRSPEVIKQSA